MFQFSFLWCSGKELQEEVTAAVCRPVPESLGGTRSCSLGLAFLHRRSRGDTARPLAGTAQYWDVLQRGGEHQPPTAGVNRKKLPKAPW